MANINSFAKTTEDLTSNVEKSLESLVKLNESLTTKNDTVEIEINSNDPITGTDISTSYSIPSYNNILNRLNTVENTVNNFIEGKGLVAIGNSSYQQITTTPIAKAPSKIVDVVTPTTFSIKDNWFFEDMIYPSLVVSLDLSNKVNPTDKQVKIKRLIVDNPTSDDTQWFINTFQYLDYTYQEVIDILNENNKKYWEDEQVNNFPLLKNQYIGTFVITDKIPDNTNEWIVLDTLNYAINETNPIYNLQLAVGDNVSFANTIYVITDINVDEKSIKVDPLIGIDEPQINGSFAFYNDPYAQKILNISVGSDECNIIFLKGVQNGFDLEGDEWSNSISFYTNTLILQNSNVTLAEYYNSNVSDFGKYLEGIAKEKMIPAYYGITPNVPNITNADFRVVQINTQINATLDIQTIKETQSQIELNKSTIQSLKDTIAQQKSQLVSATEEQQRENLQKLLTSNVNELSRITVEYNSLVKTLTTLAYENNAVKVTPKYRIRGYFQMPDPVYNVDNVPQEIVQFEIAYRYLKLDETGTALNTFSYIDTSTGQTITGVYSDWNYVKSDIKTKKYNPTTDRYEWVVDNVSNVEHTNINQIDIPIQKGEKVEIKVRSISEAGWPINPLKSDWSQSRIIDFPSNLQTTDQVTNILNNAVEQETNIKIDETLSSSGIYAHLTDTVPNPQNINSYFKHTAENLGVENIVYDSSNNKSIVLTDLQDYLDNILENIYVTEVSTGNKITLGSILEKQGYRI